MNRPSAGGGWPAIRYALRTSRQVGGLRRLYAALRSRNACKTCALGMGGQRGGMVNEAGRFPEVCKKSMQAMQADMQDAIPPTFFEDHSFNQLQKLTSRELEQCGRLTQPLYAGPLDDRYRALSWDEAYQLIAKKMKITDPLQSFFYFSGRSSNEAGFLLQLFARIYGTNHVNNCSYYCHQATGVGLSSVTGSGTATVVLEDIGKSDLVFLIGCNPASNHPRLMRSLMELRRRGGKVIVINPIREIGLERFKIPSDVRSLLFGSSIASEYLQCHLGGDIALLTGIAKAVLAQGGEARDFISMHTEHADEFLASVESASWDDIVHESGVSKGEIENAASMYVDSNQTIFCWAMGVTHHERGVETVQMIANVALLRGMVGRVGCGLLPLRGHSNVQGIGSIGATPALKKALFENLEHVMGISLPTAPGLDTLGCMEEAANGKMRFGWCLGGNLLDSNPDSAFATRALQSLDMVTYLSTTLNRGHLLGRGRETVILPVLARDEESQATTQESMFNFVRLSDGGSARHDGPRSEVEVIATVADRVLGEHCQLNWKEMRDHGSIRQAISRVVPGFESMKAIDQTKQEFQINGRTFHQPQFATDTGRAQFHAVSIRRQVVLDESMFRLQTLRSEGQFNTVVYEDYDLYRGQDRRDVLLMNPEDMDRMHLKENDRVKATSEAGEMRSLLVRPFDIRAGNTAMYFPEANVLVPRNTDPQSKTPAFKNVLIKVTKERLKHF